MSELFKAIKEDNLQEFTRWLQQERICSANHVALQVQLLEHAVLKDRGHCITRQREVHYGIGALSSWPLARRCMSKACTPPTVAI
jgi:hypothetical protein